MGSEVEGDAGTEVSAQAKVQLGIAKTNDGHKEEVCLCQGRRY